MAEQVKIDVQCPNCHHKIDITIATQNVNACDPDRWMEELDKLAESRLKAKPEPKTDG